MTLYTVEYSYDLPEWGSVELEADNIDQAELFAMEHVKDSVDSPKNIEIDSIKELKL